MKEQTVNILGFLGHVVSVAATQVCLRRMKTAPDSTEMNEHSCLPVLCTNQTGGQFHLLAVICYPCTVLFSPRSVTFLLFTYNSTHHTVDLQHILAKVSHGFSG